jgi:hypothetical protein
VRWSRLARCQGPDGNENSMEEEASLQKKKKKRVGQQ